MLASRSRRLAALRRRATPPGGNKVAFLASEVVLWMLNEYGEEIAEKIREIYNDNGFPPKVDLMERYVDAVWQYLQNLKP